MNIIRIAEQFSKLKDDNIIEEVIRYNLPIFKQTILDIKKERDLSQNLFLTI